MIEYNTIKHVHLELSNICNLRCPNCPRNHNDKVLPWLNQTQLTLDSIKTIFDHDMIKQLGSILMCGNFGDPLACNDVVDIVEYFTHVNPNISITIHTNGSLRSVNVWSELANVMNNHSKVVFSIDGLEDTNHIYRRGSNWQKLMQNIEAFVSDGGNAVWEYLIFKHNKHQVDDAKELSKNLGMTDFIVKQPHGFDNDGAMYVKTPSGDVEYIIYEQHASEKTDYKNLIPVHTIEQTHEWYTNKEYVEKFQSMWIEEADCKDHNVSCIAKSNQEIYIDAHGNVHPCCFLGHVSDFADGKEIAQYNHWLSERVDLHNINAITRSLKDIVNDTQYMQAIENSWSSTTDCIIQCKTICKTNESLLEKIYGTNFIKSTK